MTKVFKTRWFLWLTLIVLGGGVLVTVLTFSPRSPTPAPPIEHDTLIQDRNDERDSLPRVPDGAKASVQATSSAESESTEVAAVQPLPLTPITQKPRHEASLSPAPFIYVSFLSGHVGGRAAGQSETYYIGEDDEIQISSESIDGTIHSLQNARLGTSRYFDEALAFAGKLEDDTADRDFSELPEYFPPKVALFYDIPSHAYFIASYTKEELPAALESFTRRIRGLQDEHEFAAMRPGLYLRAQRLPRFDPQIQKPDLEITTEEAYSIPAIRESLVKEMALVYVAEPSARVDVGEGVSIGYGDAIHVQVGNMVYRLIGYVFEGID